MECPVCYTDNCTCKLVCGHTFCHSCVKEWYTSSETPNCPMCRKGMYFRGMHKAKAKWQDESDEKHLESIYAQVIENAIEDIGEYYLDNMELLREVDHNFHRLKQWLVHYSLEQAVEIVECYFGTTKTPRYMVWDDWDTIHRRRSMMVSNYPWLR